MTIVILPIAIALFAGWAVRAGGLVAAEHWKSVDPLSFRVLIPALIVYAIADADLSPERIGPFAIALVLAVAAVGLGVLALRRVFLRIGLADPSVSTLFQTATRWNGFISLAAADLVAGRQGVELIAVAMAVIIPLINVANILVVATLCETGTGPRRILRTLVHNPIIIACALGLSANFLGGFPEILSSALEIVGRAALGIGLLAVGAGLEPRRLFGVSPGLWSGVVFRPLLSPAIFLGVGAALGLPETQLVAGVIVTAVPAATNGYIVARNMGGDADLYADIMAWQTILALIAIPAFAYLAALV